MSKTKLFKDRITLTDYDSLIKELCDALDREPAALRQLLFGTEKPELYSDHGAYKSGQHNRCAGLKGDAYTEKRLCKCMYYLGGTYPKRCEVCGFQNRFRIVGNYRIADYEVPAYHYGDGIGEIDLILECDGVLYATEVKPYKGNNESLLRMIAEIVTYTDGYPVGNYKRAIAFFEKNRETGEKTTHQLEYETARPALLTLLKKADVTVFRFEEVGADAYRICKISS